MTMSRPAKWIQILWLGASAAALIFVVAAYWGDAHATRESSSMFIGILLALSFPLGYLGLFLLGLLVDVLALLSLQGLLAGRFSEIILLWVGLTAVGWFQWFVLLPWLYRALRKRLAARRQRAA